MEIKVIFENDNIAVIEKPNGMPSQPDRTGDFDAKTALEKITGSECFIINRLDRPVGGAVLFAKNQKSAAELTKILNDGKIEKTYTAVVCGKAEESGIMEDFILKNARTNTSVISDKNNKNAKKALLEYKKTGEVVSDEYGILSLVKIHLITGRHHQIRVQFSSRGLPLWGDTKYNAEFARKRGYFATALWSSGVSLRYKNENIDVESNPQGKIFEIF